MSDYDAGEIANWMLHGISLCQDMLWAADTLIQRGQLSAPDKARLKKELEIRQRVLKKFAGGDVTLSPAETAWRAYILQHCALEIRQARREISPETFSTLGDALLDARREAIYACFGRDTDKVQRHG